MNRYALMHDATVITEHTPVTLIENEQYKNRFRKIASGSHGLISELVDVLNDGEKKILSLQSELSTSRAVSDVFEQSLQEAEQDINTYKQRTADLEELLSESIRQYEAKSQEVEDLLKAIGDDRIILDTYEDILIERDEEQKAGLDER